MKRLFRPSSIRGKLTIWLVAVFVLLSLLYAHTYHAHYVDQEKAALQSHRETARLIACSIESEVMWVAASQTSMGEFLVERKYGPIRASRYLRLIQGAGLHGVRACYLSSQGEVVASSDSKLIGEYVGSQADVRSALSGASPAVADCAWSSVAQRRLAVTTAIYESGRIAGAMRFEISAAELERRVMIEDDQGISLAILDRNGIEVHRRARGRWVKPVGALIQAPFVHRNVVARRSILSIIRMPHDGELYLVASVPLQFADWSLIAVRPAGEALRNARSAFIRGMYSSISVTGALLILFWWWSGVFLTGRLRRLAHGAAALAVGDLRKRIHIKTGDEMEKLATAFNQMAESLEAHERQVQDKSAALQSLLDVAQVVASSLDLQTVASAISQAANRRFEACAAAIYVFNEDRGELEQLVYHSYTDAGDVVPPEDWRKIADRVYRKRDVEAAAHELYSPDKTSPTSQQGPCIDPCLSIAVPLVAGDRAVGVLVARFSGAELLHKDSLEERMRMLSVFGAHAAVALQNARTYGNAEEYARSLTMWLNELSALRYVTEAITASLDLSDILRTLARLTCEVMRAEACVITLMDASGALTVSEAHNLSLEMRKRYHCRIGDPLSGLAAAQNRPVAVKDVEDMGPEFGLAVRATREGLHGFLSCPLVSGREVIGTIDIWTDRAHDFTAYQMDLLSSIAAHAAMTIQNARRFGKEYRIAETLQSVLLGSAPDETHGLQLGCKYVPALDEAQVGGDFYDVIPLPDGKLGVVIADVSGKGLAAAIHTAMCKYMLRGFAYYSPGSPARVLRMVNDALCGYAQSRFFVTVFYCVIDPANGSVVYVNAGHPPAIWITEEGRRQTLLYQTGTPVGMDVDVDYTEKTITLAADDALLLYTDGVIDARRDAGTLGLEGLQEILFSISGTGEPKPLVERLYTEVLLYAKGGLRDDMAIVALRPTQVEAAAAAWSEGSKAVPFAARTDTEADLAAG